ncbi:MAG: oligopeptide transport system substrate-binding protein [Chloroflexota bacterium]|nr:oligopeptide transport system substrate-binding protein [Chloroflexota bacterium]
MSLRTRRSLAFPALLVMMVVACSTGTTPTATPGTGPTTPPTATGTPGTGPTTPPTATGTPGTEPTATIGGGDAPPDQQIFRIYCCATDVRSLQPQAASGSDEISIIGGLQRGLLYYDQDLGLVPSLATDLPEISDDLMTYTYHLREDALYSDGTPIVAGDVVRAARHLADPRNAFDYGYEMCYIKGAHDVLGTDFGCPEGDTPWLDAEAGTFDDAVVDGLLDQLGVTAPDDHTVVFELYSPTSYWSNITGMWLLSPVPESQTSWAEAADIVSSGPFVLSEWTHNSKMVLTPNPNWYGDAPVVQRIEISVGGDPAAAVAAWERGDLDEVGVPSSDVRRVLDTPDYQSMINRSATLSIEYWDFANCQQSDPANEGKFLCPDNAGVTANDTVNGGGGSPTQNIHFRQALTQAIDKTELINVTFAGIGVPAFSPTMPGIPGFPTYDADTSPLHFDIAAAQANLATALGELGVAEPDPATVLPATDTCDDTCQHTAAWAKMLAPMRFGYNCDAGHDQRVLYMAQAWRTALGFSGEQMDIRCTDFGTFRTERRAGNIYSIARNGWGADFPHPDNQNRDLFACGAGNNNSKYCNPDYDDLLNQGAQAADYDTALPFYQQAEQLLVEDAPVFFMRFGEGVRLIRPYVAGLTQTVSDHQNVGDVFYETIHILAH